MSNFKALVVLSVFVILLLAANIAVRYGAEGVKASGRHALVEDVEDVCGVRLERKGSPAVEFGRTGRQWRLLAPYSGSVDEQYVARFLDALATTPISDVIFDSALLKLGRARSDFALADPSPRIVLTGEDGNREVIGFGSATPMPGGVFVSVDGLDSIFVVSSNILATVDVDAERFRRRSLFSISPDAVASFVIKRGAEAPLEFSRVDSGWRIRNAAVSSQKVAEFLSGLTGAEALSFAWPVGASNETEHASSALLVGYGLDPDAAVTVTIKGLDGVDRRISFGKGCEGGRVYALAHGGTAIVTVPEALKAMAEQNEGVFTDSRLFPADARSVGCFSVLDGDVLYAFVRGKDGGWTIESPIVARADDSAADSMLARILSLSASDAVPTGEGVLVSITTNAEKTAVSRESVFGDATPEALRSPEIVRIDPVHVKRLVRTDGASGDSVAVVYDRERKAWNVEDGGAGAAVSPKGVEAVLSAINPLVAIRIDKLRVPAADLDDYGLDTPFLTVAVDQDVDGALRRNILIGRKTSGGRFATIGSSDAVFVVGEKQIERLSSSLVEK